MSCQYAYLIPYLFFRLPFKCSFEECNVELLKTEIDAHENDCKFRLVQCVFLNCAEKVPLEKVLPHIQNCFLSPKNANLKMPIINTNKCLKECNITEECFDTDVYFITCLRAHQHNFYVEIVRNIRNGMWNFWVYFLGSQKEAQFWSKFIIENPDGQVNF